jgi:hypothetical protein
VTDRRMERHAYLATPGFSKKQATFCRARL